MRPPANKVRGLALWGCTSLLTGCPTVHLQDPHRPEPAEAPAAAPTALPEFPLRQLVLTQDHVCAVDSSGSVSCWEFRLLDRRENTGILTESLECPATDVQGFQVHFPQPVRALASGTSHLCALGQQGEVWCHPSVHSDSLTVDPDLIALPAEAVELAAGDRHTCALLDDGRASCWGFFLHNFSAAAKLVDLEQPIQHISAGRDLNCALFESGDIACWGDNGIRRSDDCEFQGGDDCRPSAESSASAAARVSGFGRTGYLDANRVSPQDIVNLGPLGDQYGDWTRGGPLPSGVSSIESSTYLSCATTDQHKAYCWGGKEAERLGFDNFESGWDKPWAYFFPDFPVQILRAGGTHLCALSPDGRVACRGHFDGGYRLSDGSYVTFGNRLGDLSRLVGEGKVCGNKSWGRVPEAGVVGELTLPGPARDLDVREGRACALLEDSRVMCWTSKHQPFVLFDPNVEGTPASR